MTTLFLDIETIPTDLDWVIDDLRANIKPPAQYKKPDSIAEWMEANAEIELAKAIHATGLDGSFGRIACIGYAFDDEPVQTVGTHLQMTEHTILADFAADLHGKKIDCVVGHNLASFDLPYIRKRAVINGVKLNLPFDSKPWGNEIFDTMLKWDAKKFISADKLARVLGVKGKGDADGSMVWDMYQRGEHQAIADYCADDVRMVREIYKRMIG